MQAQWKYCTPYSTVEPYTSCYFCPCAITGIMGGKRRSPIGAVKLAVLAHERIHCCTNKMLSLDSHNSTFCTSALMSKGFMGPYQEGV